MNQVWLLPNGRFTSHKWLGFGVCLATLASALLWFGLPTLVLVTGFWLLIFALGLLWASISALAEEGPMSLEEAIELATMERAHERKVSLLRALKDLEYERGLGKISEEDYLALSQRYRREAKHLLEQLDTEDASLRKRVLAAVESRLENKA